MQHHTTDAAKACNVTVNTVRNWCKDYGAYLSPGATATTGNRTFSGRDLSVLKYIALLRSEGMQKGAIVQRLGETTFAEIDTDDPADVAPQTSLAMQESHQDAPAVVVALHAMQTQIDALQQAVGEDRIADTQKAYQDGMFRGALIMGVIMLGVFAVGLVLSWGR